MAQNYKTWYLGSGGLVVSNSPTETERAKKQFDAIKQIIGEKEVISAQQLLEDKKKDLLSKMPRPLSGGAIDLVGLQTIGQQTIQAYTAGMLQALKNLQSKDINLSGSGVSSNGKNYSYSTAEDVANSTAQLSEVKDFLQALVQMEKDFNKLAKNGDISNTAWQTIKSRFFLKKKTKDSNGQAQQLFAAMHRILNGTTSGAAANQDMARVFNAIRGDFGNALGKMMEGLLQFLVESDAVQDALKDKVGNQMASFFASKSLGSGVAQEGTIRAYVEGVKYEPKRQKKLKGTGIKGNQLRDAELTMTTGPDGGTITWGISAKQYNFYSRKNSQGAISIAELSFQNFADVFSRIRGTSNEQRAQSRGQNALYGYRLLSKYHDKGDPMLLYVLSHRVGEITFGTSIGKATGSDTAELMAINGKLMNTADVLEMGELTASTSGFPKNLDDGWWHPNNALDNVAAIHQAKLVVQLEFGKQNAIANFGNTNK